MRPAGGRGRIVSLEGLFFRSSEAWVEGFVLWAWGEGIFFCFRSSHLSLLFFLIICSFPFLLPPFIRVSMFLFLLSSIFLCVFAIYHCYLLYSCSHVSFNCIFAFVCLFVLVMIVARFLFVIRVSFHSVFGFVCFLPCYICCFVFVRISVFLFLASSLLFVFCVWSLLWLLLCFCLYLCVSFHCLLAFGRLYMLIFIDFSVFHVFCREHRQRLERFLATSPKINLFRCRWLPGASKPSSSWCQAGRSIIWLNFLGRFSGGA